MARTWNKADLVDAIAEETKLRKKDVADTVDALVGVVTKALSHKDKVTLMGFGSFEVRERKARKAKNLRTGEDIVVPAASVPTFKAGKALKDAVK